MPEFEKLTPAEVARYKKQILKPGDSGFVGYHLATVIDGRLFYGFELTQKFFQTALEEGAHLKLPTVFRKGRLRWQKNIQVTKEYLEGPDTLEMIGEKYGVTREDIRTKVKRTIYHLWLNTNDQTRALFPYQEIPLAKPTSLESRRRISLSQGGLAVSVADLLREGQTASQVVASLGLNSYRLTSLRRTLQGWGEEVPYLTNQRLSHERTLKMAAKLTDPKTSDLEIKKTLAEVNNSAFNYLHRKGVLITIGAIAKECGIHFRPNKIMPILLQVLQQADPKINVKLVEKRFKNGVLRYYVVAKAQVERVKQLFENDQSLEPLKQER